MRKHHQQAEAASLIGIFVGSILLLACAVGLVVFCHKRTSSSHLETTTTTATRLVTNNVKWIHDEGHICVRPYGVQFVEYDKDVVTVQEIINNKIYTYAMVHTDFLYQEVADLGPDKIESVDTKWIDNLVGYKYDCVVESIDINDSDEDMMNDLFQDKAEMVSRNRADQSTTWKVGAWTIQADANLRPVFLSNPPPHDDEDDDDHFHMVLTGIETCNVPILGCDPKTQAGDHVPYQGPTHKQIGAVMNAIGMKHEHGNHHQHNSTDGTRFLWDGLFQDFQNFASRTNWCGSGQTPTSDPCPGDASIDIPLYDYDADRACRRHDHAKRVGTAWGAPIGFSRAECLVDQDMIVASNNLAVDAVLGRFGLASTWGCLGFGNYKCWKKWWYKCQCRGERVRYGAFRYENNERNPEWGYRAPDRVCPDDLWSCENPNQCSTIREPKAREGSC